MKLLRYSAYLLSIYTLSLSSIVEVDMNYWRAWTSELEETKHLADIPYIAQFCNGNQTVTYCLLTNDPELQDTQKAILEPLLHKEYDCLIQQATPFEEDNDALAEYLEKHNITLKDFFYFKVTELLNQRDRYTITEKNVVTMLRSIIKEMHEACSIFDEVESSTRDYKKWFKEKMHQACDATILADGYLVAPTHDEQSTFLQHISYTLDRYQDEKFLQEIAAALNAGKKNIIVTRACSKFVTECDVLRHMMGCEPTVFVA